jgi:hypothetical protein
MGSRNKPGCCACPTATTATTDTKCTGACATTAGAPATYKVVFTGWATAAAATSGLCPNLACTNFNGTYSGIGPNTTDAFPCAFSTDPNANACYDSSIWFFNENLSVFWFQPGTSAMQLRCWLSHLRGPLGSNYDDFFFGKDYPTSDLPLDCSSITNVTLPFISSVCSTSAGCQCDSSGVTCVVTAETT